MAKHQKYIKLILQAWHRASLQLDVNKYKFHKTKVLYLGLIISIDSIQMDLKKVKAIVN